MVKTIVLISLSIFLVNCGNSGNKMAQIRKSDKEKKSFEVVINMSNNSSCSILDLDLNEFLKLKGKQVVCEVYNQTDFERKKENYARNLKQKRKKEDKKLVREEESQEPEYTCSDQERHALRRRVTVGENENKILYSYGRKFFEAYLSEAGMVYLGEYEIADDGFPKVLSMNHIEYDKLSNLKEVSVFGLRRETKDFSISCFKYEGIEEENESTNVE